MPERPGPTVYSIAAHRGFADALVAGLVPRYEEPGLGLARLTLLLPSRRSQRVLTEAFTRLYGAQGRGGLLLPRMAVVGDLDLDETLGSLLDPLGAADIPPAVDPMRRWLMLADLLAEEMGRNAPEGAARLRMARQIGQTMDRLLVEEIAPNDLVGPLVLDLLGNLSTHWQRSLRTFIGVQDRWLAQLRQWGMVDAAQRRNLLFAHAVRCWRERPTDRPLVAAGVTSAAPALARMLRAVADLPQGAVILPDLDLALRPEVWDELGCAGCAPGEGEHVFARGDAVTHPQYHLKLLLNRMGVAREEVRQWHRRGVRAAPPERTQAISALFLPPVASRIWVDLPAGKRRLAGVRTMQTANPDAEAQAIAVLAREALEEPEKRVAIITPDRSLARRVVQHLRRWNITADDSAGQPLTHTAAGRLFLLLARVASDQAAPVPLLALLQHPLVGAGTDRRQWLAFTRELDLALRKPRPAPGLPPLRRIVEQLTRLEDHSAMLDWWGAVENRLNALFACACEEEAPLADQVDCLARIAEAFCGLDLWAREDGRALSTFVEALREHARAAGTRLAPRHLASALRDEMECIAVRPPYLGHTRVAIYGLIEARMTRADLVICGGLNEGTWASPAARDALLAPAVLRALGVPGVDHRIGLSAHDLAGALGAREVVLSRARRDASGPAIPSRFLLRVQALLGEQAEAHIDARTPLLGEAVDAPRASPKPYPRPAPRPTAQQRGVAIAVTALDRLRGDPYQFYAGAILGLRPLDRMDAEPSPAWQGELAHKILERWHAARKSDPAARLRPIASCVLEEMNAHPVMRGLWRPRLLAALDWVESSIAAEPQRTPIAVEQRGKMRHLDVQIHGRADRIDRMPDGTLAVVDYKTGRPPSRQMVAKGFALQLGLIGLIARSGGFDGVQGEPECFEYWSLARSEKSRTGFGFVDTPLKIGSRKTGLEPEQFLPLTEQYLADAITRWIKGDEPFTARLEPDYQGYNDYDQLMRLDEWQAIAEAPSAAGEAAA
ncbi:double-strand break repair protein AddB [Porphyrobacter sp. GA68]|uniref:double-strand break repair protein AddB n=1 Tax=Porphyrobacter sp. GA68 TaxID=2883480 RepID=UPI001D18597D|nr:double-strand break repair protein AddB [Porphyrobacter sp. GA68]